MSETETADSVKADEPLVGRPSLRISQHVRRASQKFSSKLVGGSERMLNKSQSEKGKLADTKNVMSSSKLADTKNVMSGRNLNEPVDEEQKNSQLLSKLPTQGFNRLKGLWANRENSAGFTNPLSTWSRPYAQKKEDAENKNRTSGGRYDPDKTTETFIHFGRSIQDCPRQSLPNYKEQIPTVLIVLRDELEKNGGFLMEGVFRVAASFDEQKAYKIEVDSGSFSGVRGGVDDVMCMAALIKEWFRTMPVRLLNALPITSLRSGKSDIEKELPEPNYSVFYWLLDLMADIVAQQAINRMSPRAMAIVIAPNLYSAGETASPQEIMLETNGAVAIVEEALKKHIASRNIPYVEDVRASSGAKVE